MPTSDCELPPAQILLSNTSDPKVLIVCHRAFNDKGGTGNTLASYFKQWNPDSLAEIFFHAELPCGPMIRKCSRYYRVTDFDALRSVLGRQSCGHPVTSTDIAGATGKGDTSPSRLQQRVYEFGRKRYGSVMLLRDMMWRAARWRTDELNAWVDDFAPQVVFLNGGEYSFAYGIANYVATRCSAPLVVYLGDDWYNVTSFSHSPFYWLQNALLRRAMRRVVGSAAQIFPICDLMGEEYKRIFGVACTTLSTACGRIESTPASGDRSPVEISYLGKVSLGRWTTLRRIGEALRAINAHQQQAILRIYSTERLDASMVKSLSIPGALEFMGGLNAAGVSQVIANSDILVHVESMDKMNRKLTRLSVSTKIPEYLASGRCILAAGPAEVASIRYIQEHDAGMVVTDMEALRGCLEVLVSNPELRRRYALNALRLARQRHDPEIVTKLLKNTLRSVLGSKTNASTVLATRER